jgi:Cu/Zn superoxide dismutase
MCHNTQVSVGFFLRFIKPFVIAIIPSIVILEPKTTHLLHLHSSPYCSILGQEMEQSREAAFQGGGGHVEGSAAPEHRALLRLVGGNLAAQPQVHLPRHRVPHVGHSQNVRTLSLWLSPYVYCYSS